MGQDFEKTVAAGNIPTPINAIPFIDYSLSAISGKMHLPDYPKIILIP